MTINEIIQNSYEYAVSSHFLEGAQLQATRGNLIEYLRGIDDTVDDYQLTEAITTMVNNGTASGYDGTFVFFNER